MKAITKNVDFGGGMGVKLQKFQKITKKNVDPCKCKWHIKHYLLVLGCLSVPQI